MGIIVRESTAPIKKGETASGTEIEAEFNKVFVLVGESSESEGNLDDSNFAVNAQINGNKSALGTVTTIKIKDSSIPGGKINSDILTTAEFGQASVPQAYIDTDSGTESLTTSTSYVDIPGITAWTLTPRRIDSYFRLAMTVMSPGSAILSSYGFTFKVDGTDQGQVSAWLISPAALPSSHTASLTIKAPTASSMTIMPRYKLLGSNPIAVFSGIKAFRGTLFPVK